MASLSGGTNSPSDVCCTKSKAYSHYLVPGEQLARDIILDKRKPRDRYVIPQTEASGDGVMWRAIIWGRLVIGVRRQLLMRNGSICHSYSAVSDIKAFLVMANDGFMFQDLWSDKMLLDLVTKFVLSSVARTAVVQLGRWSVLPGIQYVVS